MLDIAQLQEKCSFLNEIENGTELAIAWITQGYAHFARGQQVVDEERLLEANDRTRDEVLRVLPLQLTSIVDRLDSRIQDRIKPIEETICGKVAVRRGCVGENTFATWMTEIKDWDTECSSSKPHCGDFIHFHYDTHTQVITDVKNYSAKVPRKEIDKLWNDMTTQNIHLGLFVSLNTRITNKRDPVDIEFRDVRGRKGAMMFVSNAYDHPEWIRVCLELLRIQSCGKDVHADTLNRIESAMTSLHATTTLVDKLEKDQKKMLSAFKQELLQRYTDIEEILQGSANS